MRSAWSITSIATCVLTKLREYTDLMGFDFDAELLQELVEGDVRFANELNAAKSEAKI